MQTPVEIDFQGMSGTPEVHASIEKHVAELEQWYGRVTACRVAVKRRRTPSRCWPRANVSTP
jgi:hypothetical protein